MTLEQCKKLKEWGLPQSKHPLQKCYFQEFGKQLSCIDIINELDETDVFLCIIPDLEQLLEFAVTKDKSISLSLSRNGWGATTCNFDFIDAPEIETMVDPDPKVAVYKLLEKILGEATP